MMNPLPAPRRGLPIAAGSLKSNGLPSSPASRRPGRRRRGFRPAGRRVDVDDRRVDALDDVGEVDEARAGADRPAAARRRLGDRLAAGAASPAATDGWSEPAGDDRADEEGDDGGQRDGDDGEPSRHSFGAQPPLLHYKSPKRFLIQRFDAELPALSRACCRRRPRRRGSVVFLLTEPDTFAPRRSSAAVASSRDIEASVPVSTKTFPASGPGSSSGSGAWLAMLTPAAASRATSARLRGSSANARTDAATTGPISATRLQRLDRRLEQPVHRPEMARQRRGRLLADVADAERVDQAREIVRLAALDLLDDVAADLAELARPRPLGPRLARRDDEVLELRRRRA